MELQRAIQMEAVLQAVREAWHQNPHMRLSQLLDNAAACSSEVNMQWPSDDAILEGLRPYREP